MRRRQQFLGVCSPRRGWLHATPVGVKFASLTVLTLVVMLARNPFVNAGLIVVLVIIGLTAKMSLGQILGPIRRMWLIFVLLVVFHVFLSDWWNAARIITVMITCVVGAQIFMLSTPLSVLLDLFGMRVKPLKFVGVRPQVPALAAAIAVRSVAYLADLADTAKDAASARGLENDIRARTVPVMLGAVKYAQDTGRALEARGILD